MARKDYTKRNFILGVLNGTLVNFGMAFIDPYTVLPVFMIQLGASDFMVGLTSALAGAGWFLPQMFVARIAEARKYLVNIYRGTTVLRVSAWAGVALSVAFLDPARYRLYLFSFIAFYLTANLGAGLAAVPFLEITSKTIPFTRRGTFFGTRRFLGGLLGVFAGLLVGVILNTGGGIRWQGKFLHELVAGFAGSAGLSGRPFPENFGILFLLGGGLLSLGLIIFCFVGEPPSQAAGSPPGVFDHLRRGLKLLRDDRNYMRFYLARISWQFTAMAFPFYSLYAYKNLGFSGDSVGVFVSLWVGSGVVSNYVWGRLLDRKGNKLVLVATAVLSLFPPAVILAMEHFPALGAPDGSWRLFGLVSSTFFVNGFIRSGRLISNLTYLLEFAPVEKRPLYVGFMNSFTFPFMLSPAIGGFLIEVFSLSTLFLLSAFFALLNIFISSRLKEPRDDFAANGASNRRNDLP